jgi:DNA repair exonuclease SbcCD nuclease subunit
MKILHTADWQLGKPFASIADEDNQARVRQARMEAITAMQKIAGEEKAGAVLVAGDLFDSPSTKAPVVSEALARMGKFPCPVYVIPGNHDHGGPGGTWTQAFFERERAELAPNVRVCREPAPVVAEGFVLYPCPLQRRAETGDTTAWLREEAVFKDAEAALPRVVLAHGSVQAFSGGGEDPEDDAGATNHVGLARLPMEAIDYVALGDWHGTKQVGPKAWYAGTPEYDRFPKGGDYAAGQVLVVEIERGRQPVVTAHPTGQLRWLEHEWEFHDDGDLETLQAWSESTFASRTRRDLLKLRLRGALGLEATGRLEELLEQLRARLLRLKLVNDTALAPTEEELKAFVGDAENPLIARVADSLHTLAEGRGEEADTAALALRELYLLRNRPA